MSSPSSLLTPKPHPFSGAFLPPKHARELTPTLVVAVAAALAEATRASRQQQQQQQLQQPAVIASSAPSSSNDAAFLIVPTSSQQQSGDNSPGVQYTVWITEAWRVLGWAEPSAALFWEMATMFHALYVASRANSGTTTIINKEHVLHTPNGPNTISSSMNEGSRPSPLTVSSNIPPILSCGSAGSETSQTKSSAPSSPTHNKASANSSNSGSNVNAAAASQKNNAASAKELPVWLVSIFLLLHLEEHVCARNSSSDDERRFESAAVAGFTASNKAGSALTPSPWAFESASWDHASGRNTNTITPTGGVLGPQTRLRATTEYDTQHRYLATFLLRHIRKLLLFCSLPQNPDAITALHQMIATSQSYRAQQLQKSVTQQQQQQQQQQQHPKDLCDDDTNFTKSGTCADVTLSPQDIERLNFILHRRHGGYSDDNALKINEVLFSLQGDAEEEDGFPAAADAPNASGLSSAGGNIWNTAGGKNSTLSLSIAYRLTKRIPLSQAESHLRRHLALFEMNVDDDAMSTADSSEGGITSGIATLNLTPTSLSTLPSAPNGTQQQPKLYKELLYSGVRGTTILMKPRKHHSWANSSTAGSNLSEPEIQLYAGQDSPLRLHDVTIVNCSDTHLYLLQPFEHVMIAACTDCTIVLGSVAGLLHVQDCERLHITSAARRICVSNSLEVVHYCFTPSPPFLVGNNRSCQFAPYNTYYDGLREDLLATGLAAAVVRSDPVVVTGGGSQTAQVTEPTTISGSLKYAGLTCASNKWKIQVELSKLEVPSVNLPSVPSNSSHSHSDGERATDDAMTTPILLPASEFHMLFIPLESEAMRMRRMQAEVSVINSSSAQDSMVDDDRSDTGDSSFTDTQKGDEESQYCRNLSDMLQSSPFRLPVEYERRVHLCAERVKNMHIALKSDDLTLEQQANIEEEMNQKFRDWLVTSGNLRQVLDLVHLESERVM